MSKLGFSGPVTFFEKEVRPPDGAVNLPRTSAPRLLETVSVPCTVEYDPNTLEKLNKAMAETEQEITVVEETLFYLLPLGRRLVFEKWKFKFRGYLSKFEPDMIDGECGATVTVTPTKDEA